MSFTHSVGVTYRTAEGTITNTTDNYTADGQILFSGTVANSATQEVDVAIDVSKVQSIVLYSDRAITVKTNSSGSPDDTIALAAGKQLVWTVDHVEAIFLTVDVTKFYLVNASGGTANVKIYVLQDVTA